MLAVTSSGTGGPYYNYGSIASSESNYNPTTQNPSLGGSDVSSRVMFWQWARTRAYPPNGVMPSVSLGTPSGFPYVNTTSSVTEVLDF